ncbi:thioesterase II family protein [Streptomyces sp. NPDC056921]|uniref:thioesterase II family protein n=1 Tax=Streptomyces sp. NPDC056921 TaxID=3345966 RepID=UPI0036251CA6
MTGPEPWLVSWNTPRTARTVLLCLPHPGSGAQQFRHWQESLGSRVALLVVQIPEQESSWREPPATKMGEILGQLIPAPSARLDLRYLIFGHSMWALLSHELAVVLSTRHGRPRHFVTSASRGPAPAVPRQRAGRTQRPQVGGSADRSGLRPCSCRAQRTLVRFVTRPLQGGLAVRGSHVPTPGSCPVEGWRDEAD